MSGDYLNKVKRKLELATGKIEDADQKVLDCKQGTLEAMARFEKLEVELNSAKRRMVLITEDTRVAKERLAAGEEKLTKTSSASEQVEEERAGLENEELTIEEKIENLEEGIKEMKRTLELNSGKMVESERKVKVCEEDKSKIVERSVASEARIKVLEEQIEKYGQSMQEMEEREGAAGDRETLNEDKITFLEQELKTTQVRAEMAERNSAVLKNGNMETQAEIDNWAKRRAEIETSVNVMDDVADDDAYLCFEDDGTGSAPSGGSGRSTPSTFGAKADLFKSGGGSQSGSRSGSRAGSRAEDRPAQTPQKQEPAPAPAPAPEPAKKEEESSSDDEW